jgi:hypothetical protein
MKKRVDFHQLTTLAEVRNERQRVNRALARRKEWLEEDYDRISEVFTADYWTAILSEWVSGIASGWIGSGFGLVSSLLGRVSHPASGGRRRRRRKREEEEELILIVEEDEIIR